MFSNPDRSTLELTCGKILLGVGELVDLTLKELHGDTDRLMLEMFEMLFDGDIPGSLLGGPIEELLNKGGFLVGTPFLGDNPVELLLIPFLKDCRSPLLGTVFKFVVFKEPTEELLMEPI